MELFKKTGRHPELEAQQQAASSVVPQLPDVDVHRPHVFMDLQQGKKLLGQLRDGAALVMLQAAPMQPPAGHGHGMGRIGWDSTSWQHCQELCPFWLAAQALRNTLVAGRLVIEVFEELLPIEARHFITRCQPGSSDTFQGTHLHRLVQDLAAFGGVSKG